MLFALDFSTSGRWVAWCDYVREAWGWGFEMVGLVYGEVLAFKLGFISSVRFISPLAHLGGSEWCDWVEGWWMFCLCSVGMVCGR